MKMKAIEIPRHFIDLSAVPPEALRLLIDYARTLKAERADGKFRPQLQGKKLAMIFEKNSTRTRVSFEVAMLELGGGVLSFNSSELQIGRGETTADTARVLSRYVDCIMLRCHSHERILELAEFATVPVINGLTNLSHPCQLMADILTFEEHRGPIKGRTIAWVGDGNNVANSWIEAAVQFGFSLRLACPKELQPATAALDWAAENAGNVLLTTDPEEAVSGADAVVTDTWVSMGDEDSTRRFTLLAPYQVNEELMQRASKQAIFMHCLPAHRGEEVTASVIDGPASVVWDEAENRLHVQKALLLWALRVI